ncbi:hypothetical protein Bbelb_216620 [Branchiostoma belcheri]|nr:hypothetical protein Bbelb_216620 [Branchiostoma belcheri]
MHVVSHNGKIGLVSRRNPTEDLTPVERERNRCLRRELSERRARGESNLVIRGGAITNSPDCHAATTRRNDAQMLEDYEAYTNFDPDLQDPGIRGMAIFVRKSLGVTVRELDFSEVCFQEGLFLDCTFGGNNNITIGCIYRSPSGDPRESTSKLCNLISSVCRRNQRRLVIVGDFNIKEIDWSNMSSTVGSNHHSQMFLDCIDNNFLHQHVTEPTRYRVNQEPSILDLVITNDPDLIGDIKYLPGLGRGDHCCLVFPIEIESRPEVHHTTRRNYNKGQYAKAGDYLQEKDWQRELGNLDIHQAWEAFTDEINKVVEDCIPVRKPNSKGNKLYMNKEAMRAKDKKRKAWSTFKRTGDMKDYRKYADVRNKLRSLTRELCTKFEHRVVKDIKDNPKAFWRYVTSRIQTREKVGSLISEDGKVAESDAEKAEVLNYFFASVFTAEDMTIMPSIDSIPVASRLEDIDISEEKVFEKLSELNQSKSAGPDNIHPRLLKELARHLCIPLNILFKKSLEAAKLPEGWKQAHVTPIHKKGNRSTPGNYRPVSLTSVVGKVMESIIRDSLVDHMMRNSLFTDAQHGFVPGRSCMTQLLVCTEAWTRSLQEGNPVDVIYLDFKKAFDTVPHKRLISKMERYGVGGNVCAWIEDFLSNRKQRVVVNNQSSSWKDVKSGIPQGSVLGPILFVIYINDLPESVSCAVKIFADDSKLYGNVKQSNSIEAIQGDLNEVDKWSKLWQLQFNVGKCKVLHLGRSNGKAEYTLGGQKIMETEEEKDLGVIVDNKLTFHSHTARAANKGNQLLGLIKRSFYNLDEHTIPILYKTMVRPHLEYGNVIWGPHFSMDQSKLEKVQTRATRLVPGLALLPYSERLKKLRIPSLQYRRKRGDMIQVFKIVTGQERVRADVFFSFLDSRTTRGHKYKLKVPLAKARVRGQVFSTRIVKDWNSLPEWVVNSKTVNQFKTNLDKHWMHLVFKHVGSD